MLSQEGTQLKLSKSCYTVSVHKRNINATLTVMPSAPSCFFLTAIASRFFSVLVCCLTSSI